MVAIVELLPNDTMLPFAKIWTNQPIWLNRKMEQVMERSAVEFAARWYVLHRTVLDAPSLEFFYRYALTRAASGTMTLSD